MARQEQDREDLLAEATALVHRAELNVPVLGESIVVGFRTGGEASFYFDPDTVYHFNRGRQLRRAYLDGLLYKAEGGRLVSLNRRRRDGQVQLMRRELRDDEQERLLSRMFDRLRQLHSELTAGRFELVGQVPADVDVGQLTLDWLATPEKPVAVAASPGIA